MEPTKKLSEKVTMSLSDLGIDDINEIIKHMSDVSFSEILESPYLYKLALIYAARGSHSKFMRKIAIATVGMKDTDNLGQLEIRNTISSTLKESNFDSLRKLLESEGMSTLGGKSGYDLISSVLLCDCSSEFLEFVFKQLANINDESVKSKRSILDGGDSHGLTPLISAVLAGNLACVEYLLEKGADIDVPDRGCFSEQKPVDTEDIYVTKRKNPKQKSHSHDFIYGSSKSALMYAVCTSNSDCVKLLLRYKPDLKKKCFSNLTALSYAAITSSYDCLQLLLRTPVEMDKSELMGSAVKSALTNSTKSDGLLFGNSFYFAAKSDDDKAGPASLWKTTKTMCLKRKKDDAVNVKDTNSSQGDEPEHDNESNNESDNENNDSSDENAQSAPSKEASKTPLSFCFSGKSTVLEQGVNTDKENITKDIPFSFNVGGSDGFKVQPKFTVGECAQNSRHSKIKRKPVCHTKRERSSHNTDFVKLLLGVNNLRSIAEASLPYAVLGNDVKCLKLLLSHCGNLGCKDKFDKTPLMLAAERGKTEFVEILLENWAGVDSPVSLGMQETALMLAAQNGHSECVTALLKHHANLEALNWCKETPLMYAAKNGRVECLRILLEYKADVHKLNWKQQSPLMFAVESGNLECVQLLLEHGSVVQAIDSCQKNAMSHASESGNDEILDMMMKAVIKQNECQTRTMASGQVVPEKFDVNLISGLDSDSAELHDNSRKLINEGEKSKTERKEKETIEMLAEEALPYSVKGGNMKCFEMLLQHCKNFNETEYACKKSALMLAVEKGYLECANLLIEHGADVNFISEALGRKGTSAVVCATVSKNTQCLQLLLENGACANDGSCFMKAANRNAITAAIINEDIECIKLLLKHGADITSSDVDDLSALMYAISNSESQECLKLLISMGKQIDIADYFFRTDVSVLFRYPENLKLVLKEGTLIMSKEIKEPSERDHCRRSPPSLCNRKDFIGSKLLMEYGAFDWKLWWDDYQVKELLFTALLAGVPPKKLFHNDQLVSPFEFALLKKREDVLRYLLTNLYFTTEDYQSFTSKYTRRKSESEDSDISWLDTALKTTLCHNPWRLETLCLLTVSSSLADNNVSSQITRAQQVESLPIPQKFKTILKFNGPYARLCTCTDVWIRIGHTPDILCLTKPTYPPLDALSPCCQSSCPFQGVGLNISGLSDNESEGDND